MIGSWSQVEYLDHIQLLVDGAGKSSRIYGNLRNCATVEVRFQAYTADNPQRKLYSPNPGPSFHVQLVDYDSGEPLPWEMFPSDWTGGPGVFYSTCRGKFGNPVIPSPPSQESQQQDASSQNSVQYSSVKFYVYGLAVEEEFRKCIGVIFKHKNGNASTRMTNSNHNKHLDIKIDLQVMQPIVYTMKHLRPLKWRQVKVDTTDESRFKQWNAFLQLNNDHFFWADCDLNSHLTSSSLTGDHTQLYRINQSSSFKRPLYIYFLCPLGDQAICTLHSLDPGETSLRLVYNQEPGSLCLIRLKNLDNVSPNNSERKKQLLYQTSITVSLYDLYGNLGCFKISLNDSYL